MANETKLNGTWCLTPKRKFKSKTQELEVRIEDLERIVAQLQADFKAVKREARHSKGK